MLYFPRDALTEAPSRGPSSQIFWEEVRCLLCRGGRSRLLLEAQDLGGGTGLWFAIVQCADCGLSYTNPRPVESSLPRFYPREYRCHQQEEPKKEPRFFPKLRRWRPPLAWHGDGRLLDFGCGAGKFLTRMQDYHWQVTGVDLYAPLLGEAHRMGPRVLAGTLPHPDLAPNSFDVITMWHSLEHVPVPRAVLDEARKLLTWNGKLVVAVPNLDSLAFRVFGASWCGLDLPRHLTHFTPWTLQLMLERAGFRVESVRMQTQSGWLRRSGHYACRNPNTRAAHRWLRSKAFSRLTASYTRFTRQADAVIVTAVPVNRV